MTHSNSRINSSMDFNDDDDSRSDLDSLPNKFLDDEEENSDKEAFSDDRFHVRSERINEPYIGQQFSTREEAYAFYNSCALTVGFSVRKNRSRSDNVGVMNYRHLCCSKEGMKRTSDIGEEPSHSRRERRTDCKASLIVKLDCQGQWVVTNIYKEHNHELLSKVGAFTLRSHRKIKPHSKSQMILADDVGMKPTQIYDYMDAQSGGFENLGFLPCDHYNFLSARHKTQNEREEVVVLDQNLAITNLFWADGRCIVDCNFFGDVICFDTTYKTNKYGRPLGVFVGINHHRHTVVFGAAMLYDETVQSFEWLFSTFVKTTGKEPKTILTDQAAAIASAIKNVLPNTNHRLCLWHIFQNARKNLSHVFNATIDGHRPFYKVFRTCIYECEDENVFKKTWQDMLIDFKLETNVWLAGIYKIKEKWAMVYGRDAFTGGMRSTQRSESFNRTLKNFLTNDDNLGQFFKNFDRLLGRQRAKELINDCNDMTSHFNPAFKSSAILQNLNRVYTNGAYMYQEEEYKHICDTGIQQIGPTEKGKKYIIGSLTSSKYHFVDYELGGQKISCSCKTFEFMGIMCRHIFHVLQHEGVTELPTQYALQRWSKNAKDCMNFLDQGAHEELSDDALKSKRTDILHTTFLKSLGEAVEDKNCYQYALSMLENVIAHVSKMKKDTDSARELSLSSIHCDTITSVVGESILPPISPQITGFKQKNKEKGKTRIKSVLEIKSKRRSKVKNIIVEANVPQHGSNGVNSEVVPQGNILIKDSSFMSLLNAFNFGQGNTQNMHNDFGYNTLGQENAHNMEFVDLPEMEFGGLDENR